VNIYRGVLTGYNDAFIISGKKRNELISADPKSAEIIRPILRGRDIKRYEYDFKDLWLIATHNGIQGKGIPAVDVNKYPAVKVHLDQYYSKLEQRLDKGDSPYHLRSCAYMDDFSKQKIVWAETMRVHKSSGADRFPRFAFSENNTMLDKTCFMLLGQNLKYILAIFNSRVIEHYIHKNVAVLDNGGFLMQKIYIEEFPIPKLTCEKQKVFTDIVDEILYLKQKSLDSTDLERDLDKMIYSLFGFSDEEIKIIER
jgi:hypothetical protein